MPELPPTNNSNARMDAYLQHAREVKEKLAQIVPEPTLPPEERVRRAGLIGAALGVGATLIFALISQGLNIILLAGVPLYSSVFDALLSFTLVIGIGAAITLFSVAPMKIQNRLVIALFVLLAVILGYRIYQIFGNFVAVIMEGIAFIYLYILPILMAFLCLGLVGILLRWAVKPQVTHFARPIFYWKRSIPPLVMLVTVILFAGTFFVFSPPERTAIRDMNALVQQAQSARTENALPALVRDMPGASFQQYAKGSYYLVTQHNPIPNRVTYSGDPFVMPILITAEFRSGYWFSCRYNWDGTAEKCYSGYVPPYPSENG